MTAMHTRHSQATSNHLASCHMVRQAMPVRRLLMVAMLTAGVYMINNMMATVSIHIHIVTKILGCDTSCE